MTLGFHLKHFAVRGTESATFDYACAAKEYLGHEVKIFVPADVEAAVPFVRRQFEEQFEVVPYRAPTSIRCDALYVLKKGSRGRVTDSLPELNHAFAVVSEPHGHRFAAISEWVAASAPHRLRLGGGRVWQVRRLRTPPVVPHIVRLAAGTEDLRAELAIPDDAVVFGRHGGQSTFTIDFVKAAIRAVLDERSDIWFVFLNTATFYEHERVVYLPTLADRRDVRTFINTCDYMLHARAGGEGFGIAVAEFACAGVPVLTFLGSPKRAHFDLLSDGLCIGYRDYGDVLQRLRTLQRRPTPMFSDIAERFGTFRVMSTFDQVFLT